MQTRCMAFGLPAAQGSRCAATLGCGIQPLRGKMRLDLVCFILPLALMDGARLRQ